MTAVLTPTDLYDPYIAARTKIDEEISQLEARLLSLRSARNALAPIGRLHPEVLQEIFSLFHHNSPHKGRGALLLTWISHSWREIVRETSGLWSHIDFTHPEWVTLALSRTKGCALEFDLSGGTSSKDLKNLATLIPCTLGNLSRIKKLKVIPKFGTSHAVFPEDAPEWLIPAPLLVELYLQGLRLPRNIFSGTFPSLQTLHIRRCSLDWDKLPVTRGLKNLTLAYPKTPATVDDILKLFRVIGPGLETLELNYVLFRDLTTGSSLYRDRFNFENLKLFKLSQGAHQIALFLDRISLPHRIDIEIRTENWLESNIFDSFVSCRGIEMWPVDHLEIRIQDNEMRLRIAENRSDDDDCLRCDNTKTYIQFEVVNDWPSDDFLPVFDALPIKPIKKVSFVGGYGDTQYLTVLDYIGKLGTVRELRIEQLFMSTFLKLIERQDNALEEIFDQETASGKTSAHNLLINITIKFMWGIICS